RRAAASAAGRSLSILARVAVGDVPGCADTVLCGNRAGALRRTDQPGTRERLPVPDAQLLGGARHARLQSQLRQTDADRVDRALVFIRYKLRRHYGRQKKSFRNTASR